MVSVVLLLLLLVLFLHLLRLGTNGTEQKYRLQYSKQETTKLQIAIYLYRSTGCNIIHISHGISLCLAIQLGGRKQGGGEMGAGMRGREEGGKKREHMGSGSWREGSRDDGEKQ